uniref:Myb-like domain-containing protein n=1 Tax=Arcella intermedia TaxID=1963864 RepID=A0A6B2L3Z4_9EUKA
MPAADKIDLESADLENMTIKQILTETIGGKKTKAQIARDDEKQRKLQQVKLERTVLRSKGGTFPQKNPNGEPPTLAPPSEANTELTEEEELRRIEAESQRELEEREREAMHALEPTEPPCTEQVEIGEEEQAGEAAGGAEAAGEELYWEENEEGGEAAQAEGAAAGGEEAGLGAEEENFDLALSELADEEEVMEGRPRVKLVNGKMVIDNESLYTLAPTQEALVKVHTSSKKLFTGIKKYTRDKWSEDDTDLFYQVIRMCGSDFTMIQAFFPQKTRAQIRNKYKKEEKDNPKLLDWCFKNSIPLDIDLFKQKTGYVEPEDPPETLLKVDSNLLGMPEYHQPVVNHYKNADPIDKLEEPFEEDDEDDYNRPEDHLGEIDVKDEEAQNALNIEENEEFETKGEFQEHDKENENLIFEEPLEGEQAAEEDIKKPVNDGDEDFSFSLLT